MSSMQKIKRTIVSTQKTETITGAMQLVSASKLGVAQLRMNQTRPYSESIRRVLGHLTNSTQEYPHPFLEPRTDVKTVGMIVVSTDRGLCGSLNINLMKKTLMRMRDWEEKGAKTELCLIGQKAHQFFNRIGCTIRTQSPRLGDAPTVADVIGVVKNIIDGYLNEEVDRVVLCYNRFKNVMIQEPQLIPLLPITQLESEEENDETANKNYIYEPEPQEVIDILLKRYLESQVYQAVVENLACEQASRMMAMRNASENAKEIIDELRLVYNKARQATITQELAEIVAGADAL